MKVTGICGIIAEMKKGLCIYNYHPLQDVSCLKLRYFFRAACLLFAGAVVPLSAFTEKTLISHPAES